MHTPHYKPLYRGIASILQARDNCRRANNIEWVGRHCKRLNRLVANYMPSGSGIDSGTELSESSTPSRLVFTFAYHHMDESGMYSGWTDHKAIVTPSLTHEFNLRITGRDRNDVKEYLYQTFDEALHAKIDMTRE
jgi:hypothetical protein